jgi:tetratricopeptide (TPR) repeat protein
VYALDRTSALNVDVVVLEGVVAVHAPGRADVPDMVPAHTRWRRQPAMRSALRPEEEASFAALLAPRATDQPATSSAQAPPRIPSVEDAPRPVVHGSVHGSIDSPDLCLARARAALNRGNKRAALDWYRRLRDRYPNDEAARTVLVTSGRLEMDLGAAARALDDFQAYLRDGDGALDVEALAGTARALRALGRVNEERRAIDRYLARFPNGFDAPLLRSRLTESEEPSRAHAIDSRR